MDSDPEFEALADEAVTSWGESGGDYGYQELESAITILYRSRLEFPPAWTECQRERFIAEQASTDADEIVTRFDDLIETVTDRLWRDHYLGGGPRPVHEDISAEIAAARRDAIDDLKWRMIDEIPDAIIQVDCELADSVTD
jgi:hypothetical protein